MVRCFQVAGLTFSLELPDDFPAAGLLHNYDPFEVPPPRQQSPQKTVATLGSVRGRGPLPEEVGGVPRSGTFSEGSCCRGAELFELKLTEQRPEEPGEPLLRSKEQTGEPVVGFFRSGGGYQAAFAPGPSKPICGILEMRDGFREGRLYTEGSPTDQAFAVNNALMLLYAFAAAPYRALEMHASVVTRGGRGFLFLGKSGTGKSTHSRLWLEHISGTELLNDDNPVLRVVDGVARVYGSPWSGKTPCYKAQDVPVGAIVRLTQAPHNRIERLSTVQSYASVMASCSGFRPIRALADAQHETLTQVVQLVPCYHLECLPDADAARLCNETVDG